MRQFLNVKMPFIALICAFSLALNANADTPIRLHPENGATVIVLPDPTSSVVSIDVFVRAGVAEEEGISGLGNLAARALFGSNENQSRDAVRRYITSVGGNLETSWEPDYTLISCVTTRQAFLSAFYVISQALKTAEFDNETVTDARRAMDGDVARETQTPFRVAYAALRTRLFSAGPYRTDFGGNSESLKRLTFQGLKSYFHKRFTPANIVVSIVGNVSVAQVQSAIKLEWVDFDRPSAKALAFPNSEMVVEPTPLRRKVNAQTTLVSVGFRGPAMTDKDYPAYKVLEAIVGGGKSSRLFRQVRDSAGIGYAVGTYLAPLAHAGCLIAYAEFDPAHKDSDGKQLSYDEVQKLMVDSVQSVIVTPPTMAEVERAKRYVSGSHALLHQRTKDRAFYLGWYEAVGLGYEFDAKFPDLVSKVTMDDVKRLASVYLQKYAVAIVSPDR